MQGLGISLFGAFLYVGLKLGLVEFFDVDFVKEMSKDLSKTKYYFYVALLSWCCSCISGFISYPIETIRRKMMVEKFESWKHCYRRISEDQDGMGKYTAFFSGCVANFVLSITSMMIITLYKIMKDQIFQHCI